MAISIPTSYEIAAPGSLVLPVADAEPLAVALRNANAYQSLYRPPLRSVIYMDTAPAAYARTYRMAVLPSSDGIAYRFLHYCRTGAGVTDITVEVEWQTSGGGWTTIYGPTAHAAGASAVVDISHTAVIPAAADEIRVTYSRGVADFMADSLLIVPEPAAPTGRTTSGMWPYDDGLLGAAGAPINTELVCRPWRNTAAIHLDRGANIASLVQRADTDAMYEPGTAGVVPDGSWLLVGRGVAAVPYLADDATVEVRVIADAAITASDRIRVVCGGLSATLDASAGVEGATLYPVPVSQPGTLTASIMVEVYALASSIDAVLLWDAAVWLAPSISEALPVPTTATDPAATMALLHAVVRETERRCMAPWPQTAHMVDGITTGVEERRWRASIPPATSRGRMALVRAGSVSGALQTDSVIETTTTSAVPAVPGDEVVVDAPTRGAEGYLSLGGDAAAAEIVWSSSSYDVAGVPPATAADRQIELPEGLAPAIEVVQTSYCCGAALHYVRVRPQVDYGAI